MARPLVPIVSLLELSSAARLAGEQIMRWYKHADLFADAKADQSPVTQADLAAHRSLMISLPKLLPGVPIVSEEGGGDPAVMQAVVNSAPVYWLVDPLDGTRDYLKATGDFSVNIALMVDAKPVLGCVYAPSYGSSFVAAQGEGAFRQDRAAGDLVPVRARRSDPERFVCLVSRSHHSGEGDILRAAYPLATCKAVGSALKYTQIAEGVADFSIRITPTCLWDTAAAQCVLEQAGGALLNFSGQPLSYRTGILENPPFVAIGDPDFSWRAAMAKLEPFYKKSLLTGP